MSTTDRSELLGEVRRRYAAVAQQVDQGNACCGQACCGEDGRFGAGQYDAGALEGLPAGAVAASLGCGNPFLVAELSEGEVVLDLGSGGGIDVLLSARRVGPSGRAYGLDMTPEMLDLARRNAAEAGVENVEFLQGHIEDIPLPDASVDVVISNCVINLSPDKARVFAEINLVLRPGGRLAVTDVVAEDHLSPAERAERGSWSSCVAGALSISEYRAGLRAAGLVGVSIQLTHGVADGLHSGIVRAQRPVGTSGEIAVRRMQDDDWEAVRAIYEEGIATGNATFEQKAPPWEEWNASHLRSLRFVAVDRDETVVGWAAAGAVSERCAYAGVVEHSIYVSPPAQKQGVGRLLLETLVAATDAAGIWTVQAGIFPENRASLALHERSGFRTVGRRERIGKHGAEWRDVILVERRGPTIA